ncbi:MAG: hypothetical protein AAGF79_07920 [Pseudomonadota bacterium]
MPKSKLSTEETDISKGDKKKSTSLRLNKKTLNALKIRAIEDETSVQKIIETLVEDYLKNHGK